MSDDRQKIKRWLQGCHFLLMYWNCSSVILRFRLESLQVNPDGSELEKSAIRGILYRRDLLSEIDDPQEKEDEG